MTVQAPIQSLAELIHPYPRQRDFLAAAATHKYTLFGGAAGPGKSYILRWWLILLLIKWAMQGFKHVRVGLFCEDYPALEDRHLNKVRSTFPEWLGRLNETKREFQLRPCYGSGILAFRNLDRPSKYLSVEFAAIGIDEQTRNPRDVFDTLRMRLRWPGIEFSPMAGATNPGGIGHVWTKKLFIDRDFTGDDAVLDPEDFAFVPAKSGDNPALPESYDKTLESLPEKMRKAYKNGDWNLFVGQFFDEWDESLHVCKPFAIPNNWPRWTATDYGNAKPWCTLWLTRGPDKTIYVYREAYQTRLTDIVQARTIKALSANEQIIWHYADPSMWSSEPNGVSIAQAYANEHVELVQANNDRRAGWLRLRELLKIDDATKKPRLQVFETCPNLIRTLPGLVHDDLDVEDVDTDGEDHAPDALRYAGMGAAQAPQAPTKVRFG